MERETYVFAAGNSYVIADSCAPIWVLPYQEKDLAFKTALKMPVGEILSKVNKASTEIELFPHYWPEELVKLAKSQCSDCTQEELLEALVAQNDKYCKDPESKKEIYTEKELRSFAGKTTDDTSWVANIAEGENIPLKFRKTDRLSKIAGLPYAFKSLDDNSTIIASHNTPLNFVFDTDEKLHYLGVTDNNVGEFLAHKTDGKKVAVWRYYFGIGYCDNPAKIAQISKEDLAILGVALDDVQENKTTDIYGPCIAAPEDIFPGVLTKESSLNVTAY